MPQHIPPPTAQVAQASQDVQAIQAIMEQVKTGRAVILTPESMQQNERFRFFGQRCQEFGIKSPPAIILYVGSAPDAFRISDQIMAVSTAMAEKFTPREFEDAITHELSHIALHHADKYAALKKQGATPQQVDRRGQV